MRRNREAVEAGVVVVLIGIVGAAGWWYLGDIAFWGAVELGLVYALVGIGVYISFRVLDFPDLTVDGSFPLGAAVAAWLIVADVNPWLATLAATGAGALAGLVTATLNVKFRILHLLASILTMTALFSINIRILGLAPAPTPRPGRPNLSLLREETVVTPFSPDTSIYVEPAFLLAVIVVVVGLLVWFLGSNLGLGVRATGANPRMARAQGIRTGASIYIGMAISNGLVGLAGALFAQTSRFADVTAGRGVIVIGLAAVIIGETLFRFRGIWAGLVGCVLGAILYYVVRQTALDADAIGLEPSDLNLVTALLVAAALILPRLRKGRAR